MRAERHKVPLYVTCAARRQCRLFDGLSIMFDLIDYFVVLMVGMVFACKGLKLTGATNATNATNDDPRSLLSLEASFPSW